MNQHNNLFIEDRDARCQQLKNDWCSNQGVTEAQCVSFEILDRRSIETNEVVTDRRLLLHQHRLRKGMPIDG